MTQSSLFIVVLLIQLLICLNKQLVNPELLIKNLNQTKKIKNNVTILEFTTPESIKLKNFTETNSFISFNNWYCGAYDFDKWISHQLSTEKCPTRMYETNLCCFIHDLCYMDPEKTQNYCDSAFCFCLERTVTEIAKQLNTTAKGCKDITDTFCSIVRLFGSVAHENSQNITTQPKPLIISNSTSIKEITNDLESITVKPKPFEIAHFIVHNISIKCYDYHLTKCIESMHQCTLVHEKKTEDVFNSNEHVLLLKRTKQTVRTEVFAKVSANCSNKFCDCVASKPLIKTGDLIECETNIKLMCLELKNVNDTLLINSLINEEELISSVHFWSIDVQYFNHYSSIVSAFLGGFLALLVLTFISYFLYKVCLLFSKKAICDEFFSIARLNFFVSNQETIKNLNTCGYCSFDDKKTSSSSSCNSKYKKNQKNHVNCNSNNKNLNASSLIPLSSSNVQLIMTDGSSSLSTPSINSTE